MEYMPDEQESPASQIACCECGILIAPNPANMCVGCLRNHVDITEGIPKQAVLYFCRNCERYLQPPGTWIKASLESKELMFVCLKKLKGLNKVRLIDASFVWTEPHSKRIKVKLIVQQEVVNGAVMQQSFIVEFVINNQMCDECHRVEAKDYWRSCVQVRQKAVHKKTLFYLEQLVLKHKAHVNATGIKQVHEGLDFYYQHQQDAKKMVEFLQSVVPCRTNLAKELVSHDPRSNIYNYKHTYLVEIVPICKDNVVCMPAALSRQIGNMAQICIVHRVTQVIQLIDVSTCHVAELRGEVFWRMPFKSLCEARQLSRYVVMDVEIITEKDWHHVPGQGPESSKKYVQEGAHANQYETHEHVLADVWVVKENELGNSENQVHCRTHLGHLLAPGDIVLGFDVKNANLNDPNYELMKSEKIPDVVLVKKVYGDSSRRARKRQWKLKHLEKIEEDTESNNRDYNDFLEDLEEDPTYRQYINIYKDGNVAVDTDDTDTEDAPRVTLAEMLDDLHIAEDATGEAGAPMMD